MTTTNPNQSIVILGCTGMLGHKLLQVISASGRYQVHGTVRSMKNDKLRELSRLSNVTIVSDIMAENTAAISDLVKKVKPVALVNCIGVIKQLPEANQPIPSIRINSLFPHQLAEITKQNSSRLIHFSTDCVYSGTKGFYTESDPTDPQDIYGKSKALGEVGGPGCFTIRSSIIGPEINSYLGLLEWFIAQRGKAVKGYNKALYTGFTTHAMSQIVLMLIEKFPDLSGVWNIASPTISKYDILLLINEVLNLGITVEQDAKFAIDRSLDGSRFETATGFKPPPWRQMIEQLGQDEDIQQRFFLKADARTAEAR